MQIFSWNSWNASFRQQNEQIRNKRLFIFSLLVTCKHGAFIPITNIYFYVMIVLRWTEKNATFKIAVSGLEVRIYEVSWMPQEVVSGEASRWWYVLLLRVSGGNFCCYYVSFNHLFCPVHGRNLDCSLKPPWRTSPMLDLWGTTSAGSWRYEKLTC